MLRADGVCWINLGDSYANDGKWGGETGGKQAYLDDSNRKRVGREKRVTGLKPKDLVGIPWRVAFALQADGWYLRQDIIWSKPNPMPESVRDRCTKAHEYIFMLSKSERYYYDQDAIAEPAAASSIQRINQSSFHEQTGGEKDYGTTGVNGNRSARKALENFARYKRAPAGWSTKHVESNQVGRYDNDGWAPPVARAKDNDDGARPPDSRPHSLSAFEAEQGRQYFTRNRRSVWEIPTTPFPEAHFATFPPALIEPCILAGCAKGGTVLDPFFGAGTTGLVADRLQRNCIGIELNPTYAAMAERRIRDDAPLFAEAAE